MPWEVVFVAATEGSTGTGPNSAFATPVCRPWTGRLNYESADEVARDGYLAMTFRYIRTDDQSDAAAESRTAMLQRLLASKADEGIDVIELRVQMGKSGYVRTSHAWEDDGEGSHLEDDDGSVLLIGGVTPADLATAIVDRAREHVDEQGGSKNFRVVGLRRVEGDDGEDEEEILHFLLPATMFAAAGQGSPTEARENHDAIMAGYLQLTRQNDQMFRWFLEMMKQSPVLLAKVIELVEHLGDQIDGGRQHDLQQVLSILEFEAGRDQRWMEHDAAKHRTTQRANIAGRAVEVAGPDVMTLLQQLVTRIMSGGATQPESDDADSPTTASSSSGPKAKTSERKRSAYAKKLDDVLNDVPKQGIAKSRLVLTNDEWDVIEAARVAPTDEEFRALAQKLYELWTAEGEEVTKQRMGQLVNALGMKASMALVELMRMAQSQEGTK